jgi:6-phosphogluconolactonase (cycloisomerase 2 family)
MNVHKTIIGFIIALALILVSGIAAQAVVYTMSNEVSGNQVIAFDVGPFGNLETIGEFSTQGVGTGGSLGNQSALALDGADRWLFVPNAGDGTITSFRILENGLEFVNRIPSGGFSPISITVFGTLVYVLNEGDPNDPVNNPDNISGFRFNVGGILEAIPDSTRLLSQDLTDPAQIGFNKSGTVLLVTEKGANTLTTYVMEQDGTPAATAVTRPSAVPVPFGFSFGDRDYVFITEANPGGRGVIAVYRVDRGTGAVSDLVDLLEAGAATCWAVLSNDQTVGYATNTGSDSLTLFKINFNGTIEPFFQYNPDREIFTGSGPLDLVLTQNNRFLFTLNSGDDEIRAFYVLPRGNIIPFWTVPVPDGANGLAAR